MKHCCRRRRKEITSFLFLIVCFINFRTSSSSGKHNARVSLRRQKPRQLSANEIVDEGLDETLSFKTQTERVTHPHLTSFSKRSKKSKSKSGKGKKKGSKIKKKRGKGRSGETEAPTISTAPTSAPTCLECDDYPYVTTRTNSLIVPNPRASNLVRTRSVERVVFWGTLFVLIVFTWLIALLYLSFCQKDEVYEYNDGIIVAESVWKHDDMMQQQHPEKTLSRKQMSIVHIEQQIPKQHGLEQQQPFKQAEGQNLPEEEIVVVGVEI